MMVQPIEMAGLVGDPRRDRTLVERLPRIQMDHGDVGDARVEVGRIVGPFGRTAGRRRAKRPVRQRGHADRDPNRGTGVGVWIGLPLWIGGHVDEKRREVLSHRLPDPSHCGGVDVV